MLAKAGDVLRDSNGDLLISRYRLKQAEAIALVRGPVYPLAERLASQKLRLSGFAYSKSHLRLFLCQQIRIHRSQIFGGELLKTLIQRNGFGVFKRLRVNIGLGFDHAKLGLLKHFDVFRMPQAVLVVEGIDLCP